MKPNPNITVGSRIVSLNSGALLEVAKIDCKQGYYISVEGIAVSFDSAQFSLSYEDLKEERFNKSLKIAALNDKLRINFETISKVKDLGMVFFTSGMNEMFEEDTVQFLDVARKVANFTDFQDSDSDVLNENDPYGEHDFGAVMSSEGIKCFFKIDYFDRQERENGCMVGANSPEDEDKTFRVLTLMLASEY